MARYHPGGDLAPRDIVARSIVREEERTGGPVFLTLAHLDEAYVRRRFPTIAEMCRGAGFDLARDFIPVGPAAHYIMGGVDTDEWGRTSLAGLYAAGEVACTGVHGANRLASNSLLEGLVFGARAATAMQEPARPAALKGDRVIAHGSWLAMRHRDTGNHQRDELSDAGVTSSVLTADAIRDLMWKRAGLFRLHDDLQAAVAALDAAQRQTSDPGVEGCRLRNLITVAGLIAHAALRREESRGGHYRSDFPQRDDQRWKIHVSDALE